MFFTAVLVQACIKTILCLRSSSFLLREGYEISSSDSTLDVSYSSSLLQCASRCLTYDDCQVASFDKNTNMCSLHGNSYLSYSNNSRYEIMEITGRERAVSENEMSLETTETSEHLETTKRSGTAIIMGTTKALETTEHSETTWSSGTTGIMVTLERTSALETTVSFEKTETSGTTVTLETTEALETAVPFEETETSGTTTTSQTVVALETTMTSETTTALKMTVTSETPITMNWTSLGADDCFPTTSLEYSGTLSYTVSGIPCQYWNESYPHTISNFPVDNTANNTNYCRETTNREGAPICYTTNTSVEWEYCFIVKCNTSLPPVPVGTSYSFQVGKNNVIKFTCNSLTNVGTTVEHCPVSVCDDDGKWTTDYAVSCTNHDCYTTNSQLYAGKVGCTVKGRPCIAWNDAQRENPGGADGGTNYCRDPDGKGKPWCYVSTTPSVEWDYCPVPRCYSYHIAKTTNKTRVTTVYLLFNSFISCLYYLCFSNV